MTLAFLVLALAAAAWGAYRVVARFQATEGSLWQRLVTTAMGSASVLWGGVVAAGGGLMSWSVLAADALNQPDVRAFIESHLKAEYVGAAIMVIGAITVLARLRTLWSAWRATGGS